MKEKVVQMIGIGAKFIQDKGRNQTAEAARIGASQQSSGLSTVVVNCSNGILQCLKWIAEFMGDSSENYIFELNQDFYDSALTAQEVTAVMMLSDSGYMAKSDVIRLVKKAGWLDGDRTVEDIEQEVEENGE